MLGFQDKLLFLKFKLKYKNKINLRQFNQFKNRILKIKIITFKKMSFKDMINSLKKIKYNILYINKNK